MQNGDDIRIKWDYLENVLLGHVFKIGTVFDTWIYVTFSSVRSQYQDTTEDILGRDILFDMQRETLNVFMSLNP